MKYIYIHFANYIEEFGGVQSLSEYIGQLFSCSDKHEIYLSIVKFLLDKMTIDFHVFSLIILHRVIYNINCGLLSQYNII
jgi:hypothetical protein